MYKLLKYQRSRLLHSKEKNKRKNYLLTTRPTTPSSPIRPIPVSKTVTHKQTQRVASDLWDATGEMSPLTFIEEEICFFIPEESKTCAGQAEVQ